MDANNMTENKVVAEPEKKVFLQEKTKKIIFFAICTAPFILQFLIFYVFVNLKSFALAFQTFSETSKGYVGSFAGLENFKFILNIFATGEGGKMIYVSFLMYAFILCLVTPLSILFGYYIYKKMRFAEFFRVILFMPQVISVVVMTALYQNMVGIVYKTLTGATQSLLEGSTAIYAVIVFTLLMGFGGNVLLASGAMGGIDPSVVEACKLDGCTPAKEFIHITLPSIYPTIVTFIVVDLSAIFVNQMNMFTFFGQTLPEGLSPSVGYFMYVHTYKTSQSASGLIAVGGSQWLTFPQLSAMGLMITLIVLPITLIVRYTMNKLGPSED